MDRDDHARHGLVILALLVGIVTLALSLTTYVIILPDLNQHDAEIRTAAIGQCERVQDIREHVNQDNQIVREALMIAAGALQGSAYLLSRPGAVVRNQQAERLTVDAYSLLYLPPVDCVQAVDHPLTYELPTPRLFSGP